jgi:peptidoglycan/LPS O-acetylase OafA/YrhL
MSRQNGYIPGIDVLRWMAALAVLFYHLSFWVWSGAILYRAGGGYESYKWLAPYTWFGWIGVEVFFVISGVVIANSAQRASPLHFLKSRAIRLYPAAWICATITLVVRVLANAADQHGYLLPWVQAMLLLPAENFIDGSYWTLSVEITFYTLILLLLAARAFDRWLSVAMISLGVYSSVSCIFLLCTRMGIVHRTRPGVWLMEHNESWWITDILVQHGMFFAIGSLLWLCLYKRATVARVAAIVFFLFGACAEICIHTMQIEGATGYNFGAGLPIAIWVASLLAIVLSIKKNSFFLRIAGDRGVVLVRRLGMMTYPLYLVHQRVGYVLLQQARRFGIPDTAALVLVSSCMIALSYVIAVHLEIPIQKAMNALISEQRRPQAVAAMPL